MGIIDIIVLAILLLGLLIGFIKGFKKKHLYSFSSTLGITLGYLGGVPFAHRLMGTSLGNITLTNLFRKTRSEEGAFGERISTIPAESTAQLHTALSQLNVPSFFQGFVINHVVDLSGTVSRALASSFSYRSLIAACFLLIYLLIRLVTWLILRPLWDSLFGENGTNIIGRLFGCVYSVAKGCMFILFVMRIATLVNQLRIRFNVTTRNDFLIQDLKLDNPEAFSIGKLFYNTANSFRQWVSLIGH